MGCSEVNITREPFLLFVNHFLLIQVWDTGKKGPRLIQEVREHTKAVTCLCISSTGDKMFSGSLDKTIRVRHHSPRAH